MRASLQHGEGFGGASMDWTARKKFGRPTADYIRCRILPIFHRDYQKTYQMWISIEFILPSFRSGNELDKQVHGATIKHDRTYDL